MIEPISLPRGTTGRASSQDVGGDAGVPDTDIPAPSQVTLAWRAQRARTAITTTPRPITAYVSRIRRWHLPARFLLHILIACMVGAVVAVRYPQSTAAEAPQQAAIVTAPIVSDAAPQLNIASSTGDLPGDSHEAFDARLMPAVFTPLYIASHTLAEGETLGSVAESYGISAETVFWANNLALQGPLVAGLTLNIPRISGVPYTVSEGETLAMVATATNSTPETIARFPNNQLHSTSDVLEPGRLLYIPEGRLPITPEMLAQFGNAPTISAVRAGLAVYIRDGGTSIRSGPGREYNRLTVADAQEALVPLGQNGDWVQVALGGTSTGWVRADMLTVGEDVLAQLPTSNDYTPLPPTWIWPARGSLTSSFGWRSVPFRSFHNGIDIANRAGTPIYAASRGIVTQAGWCSGYGYCVRITHDDGIQTIYGHLLKQPVVSVGDKVDTGDNIGLMGSTYDRKGGGYSTGVHLHFTLLVNGKAVNPLKFLP